MKKIFVPYLILILIGGFARAQDSDSEDAEFSDDVSYESAFEEPFHRYGSVTLCLPLHYFPRGGAFAPHFVDEHVDVLDFDGIVYEQRVQEQEPLDGVGPLNPLTTLLHVQGVHGEALDAPIIFFATGATLDGQLDSVDNARMTAVGPIYFVEGDYVIVPHNEDYRDETTGFPGTYIRYDPGETTAREVLNQWLLDNEGWFVEEEDSPHGLQVTDEGGEVLTHYDAVELNRFWAHVHGLQVESREESIFAEIEVLVQRIFWRFYRRDYPEQDVAVLWRELMELLDRCIQEEGWDDIARDYLANYQTLLGVWHQAFLERDLLRPIYRPQQVYEAAIAEAFSEIDRLLEGNMWPTGRVTVVEEPVLVGEPIPCEAIVVQGEALPVFETQVLGEFLRRIVNEVGPIPVDTLLGAKECWF